MDANSPHIKATHKPKIFNNSERFIEGWYWLIPSNNLGINEVKSITLLGRKLVIYRGQDQQVVICDAYCPHMGAHLGEGIVEGNELRCAFHHWKFNADGICVEIPCLDEPLSLKLKTWPTVEKYGIIWVWTGEIPRESVPFVPELEFQDYEAVLGSSFVINCHPHLMMLNAIDTQYFQGVQVLDIGFEKQELNQNAIIFSKYKRQYHDLPFKKVFRPLYKNPIYSICYWYGSTFTLTVGTDLRRCYLMLALRLIPGEQVEVQTIFFIKQRKGLFGWLFNRLMLWLSNSLVQELISDERNILQTMQFNLRNPIKVDQSIMQLINHVELQKPLMWKTWLLARSPETEAKETQTKWRDELTND
ncbi:aromatic ring-hydroxylating oxygenase subunit alpha [Nostoc parmelioides]|uniref:Aromatic ring-hydroxylating dioxygenase subunit alpha n=1 Tax=Nostoc parmelioides FACHB-3921 TaxID=2692909 RepID=A0ABR8BH52_9NOSO|nr:aromatic ring-hydroxylating dioxygenase subunit alpha [Nostoc parmelioides]MBD2252323.1 aromatic ring-hydroxylating dioxygenase subunit alpha [Nostoc parmelioides FACHB-3921]